VTSAKDLKKIVKEKYGSIARKSDGTTNGWGCGCPCAGKEEGSWSVDLAYQGTDGYVPEADLNLGCGLPVKYAGIESGHVVVDLGSGAGNDVFIARRLVGVSGRVIGIDMTPEMIDKARRNNAKIGYANVEFRLGDIEDLPTETDSADVVVSNCVLNLVPNKARAFSEIFRVLKPGGHFCISDIVLHGRLPEKLKKVAELYTGCVSGAQQENDYMRSIRDAGFVKIEVKESKRIVLPDDVLKGSLDDAEIALIRTNGFQVLSVTVTGHKPGSKS
jgi:arsenite methyltransferase